MMDVADKTEALLAVMAALRTPGTGCPWDLQQTFETIAPYTIEEAYEVADAIARGDRHDLRDELGDLLFQVVYHAQMAAEENAFDFADVADTITRKMIRRHPHVFGDAADETAASMPELWEAIKAEERREKRRLRGHDPDAESDAATGLLDDIPVILPALTRALKIQKRLARVGFDWDSPAAVIAKVHEELGEVQEAIEAGDQEHVEEEIGDLLFVVANLARHVGVEPEPALARCNRKVAHRVAHMEAAAQADGARIDDCTQAVLERYWLAAKKAEKDGLGDE
ncbi:MAG: nucleoside triphosphate pyrophosphohydrolase [Pseudomonadota bacterium]